MSEELERRLREGLEGVTPGSWRVYDNGHGICDDSGHICGCEETADAAHIANCSPDNIAVLLDALAALRAENERLRREVDHWKDYSSGQGKLIQSGVFVQNDEYTQLAAKAHRAEAAEAKLAEAMEALNIESIVSAASVTWCGEKDRETFMDDIRYFENNWRSLPGLAMFVLREFLSRAHKIIGGKDDTNNP